MIKILHIIPRLIKGGAERLCLDICNELSKRENVQVKLITFSAENDYEFLTQNINLQIVPAKIQLSFFGKNHFNIDELQKAIENFSPNVIHTHLFEAEVVAHSCYYPQAKWFSHCHDNMHQFRNFDYKTLIHKNLLTEFYEKRYLFKQYKKNGGTHFIAISHDTLSYFQKTATPFEVTLLHNAINYNRFFCTKTIQPTSQLRLIHIGSYIKRKNQQLLVRVAKELLKQNINFHLDLLGDGEQFAEISKLISLYSLQEHITQHGNVQNVEEFLWKSHIYIHSSISEPFGLTMVEAMVAGLPVIATDGKGNRDIVLSNQNGILLKNHNPKEFANAILSVWRNADLYKSLSSFAQNFAKKFDIKIYTDTLLTIYETEN